MPHKPVKFRKTEMARALRAAREEGLPVERVEITNDGVIILHTGKLEITTVEDAARQAGLAARDRGFDGRQAAGAQKQATVAWLMSH